jgi:SAM-dependent methyltransferase
MDRYGSPTTQCPRLIMILRDSPPSPIRKISADEGLRAARANGYENPRPDVRALVPETSRRILDLGCASGLLGQALKREQPNRHVVGIEADSGYALEAETRLDRVLTLNLDELPERIDLLSEHAPFDCIIAADVLEHLRDPWRVLVCATSLLEVGGTAVISLPNVRHWTVIRALLWNGSWPRRPAGIFDGTHLRWFTLRDAEGLLDSAHLLTSEVSRRYWEPHTLSPLVRVLDRTPLRSFLAYQHILVGQRQT